MMSRGENLIVKQTGIEIQKEPVVMNEEKYVFVLFLFDLIPYVPSKIFQLRRDGSSWVEPVLS